MPILYIEAFVWYASLPALQVIDRITIAKPFFLNKRNACSSSTNRNTDGIGFTV